MAPNPKPITLTQRAAIAGERAPEPLVMVGELPTTAFPAGTRIVASGTAILVGGTKTVTNANALTGSVILISVQALGTVAAPKPVAVTARSTGVSFTITSSDGTDTSSVAWAILA